MQLFVASYSGLVTTLTLDLPDQNACSSSAGLTAVSVTGGCALTPSWLTLDSTKGVLYCQDRGSATLSGSLSSFKVGEHGKLAQLDRIDMIYGAVSAVPYGSDSAGLAVAH